MAVSILKSKFMGQIRACYEQNHLIDQAGLGKRAPDGRTSLDQQPCDTISRQPLQDRWQP